MAPPRRCRRWAGQRQADLTGAELLAVTALQMPLAYGSIPPFADFELAGNARTTLDTIEEALDYAQSSST